VLGLLLKQGCARMISVYALFVHADERYTATLGSIAVLSDRIQKE